jgi:Cys-rich four helix bundle protein (predicted Tat secretion target)
MAACARSVTSLIAVCEALAVLATQHSPLLPKYAAVAAEVCRSCEEECRKHAEHPVCQACADACRDCAAECLKVAA